MPVEVELDVDPAEHRRDRVLGSALEQAPDHSDETVGDVMSTDLLVVAPEDTLGEIAERMTRARCRLRTRRGVRAARSGS